MHRAPATSGLTATGTGADITSGCPDIGADGLIRVRLGYGAARFTSTAVITTGAATGARRGRATRSSYPISIQVCGLDLDCGKGYGNGRWPDRPPAVRGSSGRLHGHSRFLVIEVSRNGCMRSRPGTLPQALTSGLIPPLD